MTTENAVREELKNVTDPELHINIIDLGLVYQIEIDEGMVVINMTLTSPACPVGPIILEAVESRVKKLDGVKGVSINVVWSPPWNPSMMSEEARMELGI